MNRRHFIFAVFAIVPMLGGCAQMQAARNWTAEKLQNIPRQAIVNTAELARAVTSVTESYVKFRESVIADRASYSAEDWRTLSLANTRVLEAVGELNALRDYQDGIETIIDLAAFSDAIGPLFGAVDDAIVILDKKALGATDAALYRQVRDDYIVIKERLAGVERINNLRERGRVIIRVLGVVARIYGARR